MGTVSEGVDKIKVAPRWIALCLFLVASIPLSPCGLRGQAPTGPFRHLTIEDGLSQTAVRAILRDSDGFMWFGTEAGLNRFDGYDFHVLLQERGNPSSLSDSRIFALLEDHTGTIWIGTGEGIDRYERETGSVVRMTSRMVGMNPSLPPEVFRIIEDSDSTLWVGSEAGLFRYDRDEETFAPFSLDPAFDDPPADAAVTAVHESSDRHLWVGTRSRGLMELDRERKIIARYPISSVSGTGEAEITALCSDTSGRIWVGTQGLGPLRLNPAQGDLAPSPIGALPPEGTGNARVNQIVRDGRGNQWVATSAGLTAFLPDSDEFLTLRNDPDDPLSLGDSFINSVYEDEAGIIWFGSETDGVSRLDLLAKPFHHGRIRTDTGSEKLSNFVMAIHEDTSGKLWLGTQDGLYEEIDRTQNHYVRHAYDPDDPGSIGANSIRGIHEDENGNFWIATVGGGLNRLNSDTGRFTRFQWDPENPDGIGSDRVYSVVADEQGRLWMGSWGSGLDMYDPETGRFTHYRFDRNDPLNDKRPGDARPYHLLLDQEGALWQTTFGSGLDRFDPDTESFEHFQHDPDDPGSLSSNQVAVVAEDHSGTIWVGTGIGLNRFDKSTRTFRVFTVADGLPEDVVYSIQVDVDGNLWMGTNKGLARFDPDTETFRNYSQVDGLQSNEFNGLAHFQNADGELFFGGINGFNSFRPEEIKANPFVPPVVLTDFQLTNHSLGPGEETEDGRVLLPGALHLLDELSLRHDDEVISFQFSALHFVSPEKNQYAYMLEGFDQDWNFIGDRRFITYTNLDPGSYNLRVKASNNDGLWNEEGTSLAILVTPPFWQTLWFYALVVLALAAGVYAIHRMKVANIEARNRLLGKQVAERTVELNGKKEELEQKNRRLGVALADLQEARDELVAQAHKAGQAEVAGEVLHGVGNVMNSVNTSAAIIREQVNDSRLDRFAAANQLLANHVDDLPEFLEQDHPVAKIVNYFRALHSQLEEERNNIRENVVRLLENTELIGEVIADQQQYARHASVEEDLSIPDLIDKALSLQSKRSEELGIEIVREYGEASLVSGERSKLMYIFQNLARNATEAMEAMEKGPRRLAVGVEEEDGEVLIRVSDTGCGIRPEDQENLFSYAYTTKAGRTGLGLHTLGNYVKETGGEISVQSRGAGAGATFLLRFPAANREMAAAAPSAVL